MSDKTEPENVFKFVCGCGCGTASDDLGKDYLRLTGNRKWYLAEHIPDNVEVVAVDSQEEFRKGKIVKETDF